MVHVKFTPNLARHIDASEITATGDTVAAVLRDVFDQRPAARGYVLDDQERVRKHVVIFADGEPIADRDRLTDPVPPGSEIFIMQALSGG